MIVSLLDILPLKHLQEIRYQQLYSDKTATYFIQFIVECVVRMSVLDHVCMKPSLLYQGLVVQSIVSLTSSLRAQLVKCFRTL